MISNLENPNQDNSSYCCGIHMNKMLPVRKYWPGVATGVASREMNHECVVP
jgi:hypothetical protein